MKITIGLEAFWPSNILEVPLLDVWVFAFRFMLSNCVISCEALYCATTLFSTCAAYVIFQRLEPLDVQKLCLPGLQSKHYIMHFSHASIAAKYSF